MKARLPRQTILRGRSSFASVFDRGQGLRRGDIVAKYTASFSSTGESSTAEGSPGDGSSGGESSGSGDRNIRVGFVVRRGTGSAVRRNRIRRMLREAYRLQRREFEQALPTPVELRLIFVWVGRPETAVHPDFGAIRSDLGAALHKIIRKLQADGTADDARHTQ